MAGLQLIQCANELFSYKMQKRFLFANEFSCVFFSSLPQLSGTFSHGLKMSGHLNNTALFLLFPEQPALQEKAKLHLHRLKCVTERTREGCCLDAHCRTLLNQFFPPL